MTKLPILTPLKIEKKIKKLGFILDHSTGSHKIFYNSTRKKRAVIPFHTKDLKPGTFSAILKEAGITREEFLSV